MNLLVIFRIKILPFIHYLICKKRGQLEILIPTEEYIKTSADNEAYMLCPECNKKYHLCYIEPENKDEKEGDE